MLRLRAVLLSATLVGVPVVNANAQDSRTLRVFWEVSEGNHPTADSLGLLSGLARDARGNIYVSDRSDARVWVFSATGRSLPAVGRKGRGPGEFEAPTGASVGFDGALYVRDLELITRFVLDPAKGTLARYDTAFRRILYSDWASLRPTRFVGDTLVVEPAFSRMDPTRSGWYRTYTRAGVARDSIDVPTFPGAPASTASIRLSANGGRMLPGLNHVPFAPVPTWDVTPRGTLLIAEGKDYVVRELDRGGRVVREFRRSIPNARIPERARRDSLAALRQRIDSLGASFARAEGVPDDVRAQRVPETLPAVMAVYADADGRVWVRRWAADYGSRTTFDVFEADGRYLAEVILPRAISVLPAPVLGLTDVVAIVVDPETGANGIVRFTSAVPRS
jgi:hypothetical protein